MTAYVHHVPGRLRVRARWLKGDTGRVRRIKERLKALQGVLTVACNPNTGSILTTYEVERCSPLALLEALKKEGVLGNTDASLSSVPRSSGAEPLARLLVAAVAGQLIEALIQRSALALAAAIL